MKINNLQDRTKNTIAVFGSAFNPPHRGHEDVVIQALKRADLVLLVPSYRHAFGKQMAPYGQRFKMAEAMATSLSAVGDIRVSDIEQKIAENKSSDASIYTYDVLCALEEDNSDASYFFVLGPDNAEPATWNKFYRAEDFMDRWSIWAAQERVTIRSTMIRNKLAKGILPSERECSAQVIKELKAINFYREGV